MSGTNKNGDHAYSDEERAEIIAFVLVQVASGVFVSRVFKNYETTLNGVKLPAVSTFWKWVYEDDNLPQIASQGISEKLAQARAAGIEVLLDQCVDISDEEEQETYIDAITGEERVNRGSVQRNRLRVDTRIKLAQMLKPKTYSPKLDVTTDGEKIQSVPATIEAMRRRVADGMKEINDADPE